MSAIENIKVIPNEIKRPDVDVFYDSENECVWAENKEYKLSYVGHPEREYI